MTWEEFQEMVDSPVAPEWVREMVTSELQNKKKQSLPPNVVNQEVQSQWNEWRATYGENFDISGGGDDSFNYDDTE